MKTKKVLVEFEIDTDWGSSVIEVAVSNQIKRMFINGVEVITKVEVRVF